MRRKREPADPRLQRFKPARHVRTDSKDPYVAGTGWLASTGTDRISQDGERALASAIKHHPIQ
jgi:hypothetical protein